MSVFPFFNPETVELAEANQELPLFQEYAYDFENNEFLLRNGKTYLVSGNDALKIWMFKALHTTRFVHSAHTFAYGNEIYTLIGKTLHGDIVQSELQRFITEALMVNPYILELADFDFDVSGASVDVGFSCTTVYGSLTFKFTFNPEGG